jgi:non-specific serine/threonine protein kinase
LTSFVGRRTLLVQVRQALAKGRLVTLTGAGGVGKSRTAVEVGRQPSRAFVDGVWRVELAGFGSPELLPHLVCDVLGVREEPGIALLATLAARLESSRMLLVLDNCEHLLDASGHLCVSLLQACPRLRILSTSRQPLGIPGEATIAVTPLDVPAAVAGGVASLMEFDAVRLFIERAETVAPEFSLDAQTRDQVVALVRKLDGMPLELELAAVLVRTLALDDLVDRLDDRLSLLDSGSRVVPARRRSLRTAIDVSHDALSEPERVLWRRLSVFAGSFTLLAAETVCVDERLAAAAVAPLLAALIEKSVVLKGVDEHHGRYRMLEALRQFAREQLVAAGEERAFIDAHGRWCMQVVRLGAGSWWSGNRQEAWLRCVAAEQSNLRAALDSRLRQPGREGEGLALAAGLLLHWTVRNQQQEAVHYLDALLSRSTAETVHRAGALFARGYVARSQDDADRARSAYEECLRISSEHGYAHERGWALAGLGLLDLLRLAAMRPAERGDEVFLGMRSQLRVAADLLDAAGDPVIGAWARCLLGELHAQMGQTAAAQELMQEAVAISEAAGDIWAQSNARARLGILCWERGDRTTAHDHLRRAISAQREIGHRWGLAMSLEGIAYLSASAGRFEKAACLLGAADGLWSQVGFKLHELVRANHEACADEARERLGDARYSKCYRSGLNTDLDELLDYALAETNEASLSERPKALGNRAATPRAGAPRPGAAVGRMRLSPREMQVATLVAEGLTNRQIADALFVAERTVKTHVEHIMNKLGVSSRLRIATWRQLAAT